MSTTALGVKGGEQTRCLDDAGRGPAGEPLAALLTPRAADRGNPRVMADALTRHAAAEATRMRWHCLAHGPRKCRALEDVLPQACAGVIESLPQVCDHAEEARVKPRSPAERFAYHQRYSAPSMDRRQRWRTQQVDERLVAPHSSLGQAIASLLGHWETLPRCVSVPGAPLDNNPVERALQRCIRQRKHALCYATADSAYSASVLTRLRAPCRHTGGNAVE